MESYFKDIEHFPLLSQENEKQLATRSLKGDLKARHKLVESNLRLVITIAKSFKDLGVPFGDLIAEGNLGLMKAAERFDPTKGVKFSSYSAFWIKQKIRICLTKMGKTIRIPNRSLQQISKIRKAETELENVLNRKPTNNEIADYTELALSTVNRLRELKTTNVSLQDTLNMNDEVKSVEDMLVSDSELPYDRIFANEEVKQIENCLDQLTEREKFIITKRYGLGNQPRQTLEEISEQLDVSRERVRQIQMTTLNKLKHMLIRQN